MSIAFCIRFSEKQASYLRSVKAEHRISITGQLRNLVRREMYGIGPTAGNQIAKGIGSGQNRIRPMTAGSAAYAGCVKELSKIFERRKSK